MNVLKKLKNPSIVGYIKCFYEGEYMHIVMEYCEGGDLSHQIKNAKKKNLYFDEEQVLDWFIQMCVALEYIHSMKILHRDFKPSNIFLTKLNVIKIGDFGVSRVLDATLENANTMIGTPFYMSPEGVYESMCLVLIIFIYFSNSYSLPFSLSFSCSMSRKAI